MRVNCRAQVAENCKHDRELCDTEFRIYGSGPTDEEPMYDAYLQDGTYDPESESFVCFACYVEIGQPSVPTNQHHRRLEVIDEAIERYKDENPPLTAA